MTLPPTARPAREPHAPSTWDGLADHPEFRAALDRVCRSVLGWGPPRKIRITTLKAHPHRRTFEIAVATAGSWRALIGKAYAWDRSDLFAALEAVHAAGLGVPRPLARVPALALRLEEKVAGPSAQEVLLTAARQEQLAAARRCGEWLARFQAAAPCLPGRQPDLAVEPARWRAWADQIARFGEPLAAKAALLCRRLEAALPAAHAVGPCAAHGSFIPEHVILAGPRTVAIDLDYYGVADPARDAAWFVVSLERLALKRLGAFHGLAAAAEEFRRAYVAAGGRGTGRRASFYRAVECLDRGRRDLVGRRPPARDWAEVMLDEGLRAL